jgi:hypothetical protein
LKTERKEEGISMAVTVVCNNPGQLLNEIKAAIASGVIQTWLLDNEGDFTHSPPQWKFKAWLRPRVAPSILTFNILAPTTEKMSKEIYGIYHGRFIEMLLAHFDLKFVSATASALATTGDVITA